MCGVYVSHSTLVAVLNLHLPANPSPHQEAETPRADCGQSPAYSFKPSLQPRLLQQLGGRLEGLVWTEEGPQSSGSVQLEDRMLCQPYSWTRSSFCSLDNPLTNSEWPACDFGRQRSADSASDDGRGLSDTSNRRRSLPICLLPLCGGGVGQREREYIVV